MKQTFADIVLEILRGKELNEIQRRYYLVVKTVIAKRVRLYFQTADYKEIEDLTEEITQDFFLWLLREDTKKEFSQKKARLTSGYLLKKISGLVIDRLRKVDTLRKHISESLDKRLHNLQGDEDEKQTLGDVIPDKENPLENIDWKAGASAFLSIVEKHFKEEQLRTLCHWIFRDKYSTDCFLEGLTPSAKYKRVERLKKVLKELLEKNPLEVEEWKSFIELMEVYCQKRFGKCV